MAKYIVKIELQSDNTYKVQRIGNFLQGIVKNVTEEGIMHLLENSSEEEVISLLATASKKPHLVKTALKWI